MFPITTYFINVNECDASDWLSSDLNRLNIISSARIADTSSSSYGGKNNKNKNFPWFNKFLNWKVENLYKSITFWYY